LKGQCPTKLCSGSSVSKGQLANFKGSFMAASDLDIAVMHPDWSLAEIRAMQGNILWCT
jgi:hypothetical protein